MTDNTEECFVVSKHYCLQFKKPDRVSFQAVQPGLLRKEGLKLRWFLNGKAMEMEGKAGRADPTVTRWSPS